jgi:hypothetical protein
MPTQNHQLNLTQQITLLFLDQKQNNDFFQKLEFYSFVASLLDLRLMDKISLEKDKVKIENDNQSDLEFLNLSLDFIKNHPSKNFRELVFLKNSQVNLEFSNSVLQNLIDQNILKKENEQFLFINREKYFSMNSNEESLIQKLRAELLEEGEMEVETQILALFLDKTNLLKHYFSTHENGQLRTKVKILSQTNANSKYAELLQILSTFNFGLKNTVVTLNPKNYSTDFWIGLDNSGIAFASILFFLALGIFDYFVLKEPYFYTDFLIAFWILFTTVPFLNLIGVKNHSTQRKFAITFNILMLLSVIVLAIIRTTSIK